MNFEGLEQFRSETTKKVMETLADIVTDSNVEMADRLKAAKLLDGMSDSIIKAYMASEFTGAIEKTGNSMKKQIDRLEGKD